MAKKSKVELKRVGINLPVTIVEQVEEYADSLGLTATSAYIVLLNRGLEQTNMIDNLPGMFTAIAQMKQIEEMQQKNSTEK